MWTVINNVETSRRNSYTWLHPFTYWRQMRKSHSDAVEITLTKLVSLASIRLRGTEMAANRKRHSYCDVTTIRQTRHFRFWRRQISRWRRRWSRQTGGTAFSRLLLSFNVCTLRVGMLSSCTRVGLPYYYGTAACATFAYFLCTMHVNIAPIRFNNVSLCPSIFISNISGLLLCPRVLNPARRLASLMR